MNSDSDSTRRKTGQDQSVTCLESLPSEIQFDILSRLPVSSVMQIGYVCQSWRVLARKHLDILHHTAANLGLILHCDYPIGNELYFVDYPSNHDGTILAQKKINKPFGALMPEFEVVGSFDGLLCLADAASNVALHIYNPLTRDYIELPRTIQYPNQHRFVVFGFGYSPLTEVYKIVKTTYMYYADHEDSRYYFRRYPGQSDVQIFSTGRPVWRSMGSASHYLDPSPAETLVNGRLHWATWTSFMERYGGQLVSFDLYDEQFREIPTPEYFGKKKSVHPLVVGGCLAVVGLSRSLLLDIWVMKEYDVTESWVKEWSIRRHIPQALKQVDGEDDNYQPWQISNVAYKTRGRIILVLNVSESGHILLDYRGSALVLYDSTTGNFTELEFEGMTRWG